MSECGVSPNHSADGSTNYSLLFSVEASAQVSMPGYPESPNLASGSADDVDFDTRSENEEYFDTSEGPMRDIYDEDDSNPLVVDHPSPRIITSLGSATNGLHDQSAEFLDSELLGESTPPSGSLDSAPHPHNQMRTTESNNPYSLGSGGLQAENDDNLTLRPQQRHQQGLLSVSVIVNAIHLGPLGEYPGSGRRLDKFYWPVDVDTLGKEDGDRQCPICQELYYDHNNSCTSSATFPSAVISAAAGASSIATRISTTSATEGAIGEQKIVIENPVRLPACNHIVGKVCMTKWMLTGAFSCPICRTLLESRQPSPAHCLSDPEETLTEFVAAARTWLVITDPADDSVGAFVAWSRGGGPDDEPRRTSLHAIERFTALITAWGY